MIRGLLKVSIFDQAIQPNYLLNSVQLLLNPASGNPADYSVSIYSNDIGGSPQNYLGNLTGPTDPSDGGCFHLYRFWYYDFGNGLLITFVVTSATPVAQGAYVWNESNGVGNQNWDIGNIYYSSADGSTWKEHIRQGAFQMALYATPVPEPRTLDLTVFKWRIIGSDFKENKGSFY